MFFHLVAFLPILPELRKEKPKGFDCRDLAEAAKKSLKIPERILIINYSE